MTRDDGHRVFVGVNYTLLTAGLLRNNYFYQSSDLDRVFGNKRLGTSITQGLNCF